MSARFRSDGHVASSFGACVATMTPDVHSAVNIDQMFAQSGVVGRSATSLVSVVWQLTSLRGADVATLVGNNWINVTNAQGTHNGVSSTFNGDVLAAHDGTIQLAYPDYTNKSMLTISQVRLHYYVSSVGTLLNNGDLRMLYNVGAGDVQVEQITGNVALGDRVFDITSAIGGLWTRLDALVVKVRGLTDIAETLINYACDGVEVEVTASVTDSL